MPAALRPGRDPSSMVASHTMLGTNSITGSPLAPSLCQGQSPKDRVASEWRSRRGFCPSAVPSDFWFLLEPSLLTCDIFRSVPRLLYRWSRRLWVPVVPSHPLLWHSKAASPQ